MTGKLKFKGPKMEAMGVMGPFDGFLALTGKVVGDKASCPSGTADPQGKNKSGVPDSRRAAHFDIQPHPTHECAMPVVRSDGSN